ncbi:conserved hypothetical protein [Deferribacter desulfuricans SSM1]|uniref:Methyltransferase type 11 domain-containing protein n=1 Tax=Deferribacter desulfuricans (strain DSM 14783 / JCM 11476 / NBRC 101012 / SSM1) TaxID=639282 RepID=D3PAN3_DEFDS|nr:methyltransferase domain-containing protein [Deferribacter desulfuricans]BAI79656.1 conserved hypothetical protein [Deferribacter desulfuricans SSM1]
MFYSNINDIYDFLFPFDETTYNFLKSYAKKDLPILDIGCATGKYVTRFRNDNFKAFGLEFEKGFNLNNHFIYGDMNQLPLKDESKFGLIYSIGNTLVHVNDKLQFFKIIKNSMKLLDHKSYLLIQIINYDRIYGYNIKELPVIDNEYIYAKRLYHYDDESKITFEMVVTDKKNNTTKTIKQTITPIFLEDIKLAATKAGAGFVQFFGSFDEDKFFIKDSLMLIAALYKN